MEGTPGQNTTQSNPTPAARKAAYKAVAHAAEHALTLSVGRPATWTGHPVRPEMSCLGIGKPWDLKKEANERIYHTFNITKVLVQE